MSDDFELEPTGDDDGIVKIFEAAYLRLADKITEKALIANLINHYMGTNGITKITCFRNDDNSLEIYFTDGIVVSTNGKKRKSGK